MGDTPEPTATGSGDILPLPPQPQNPGVTAPHSLPSQMSGQTPTDGSEGEHAENPASEQAGLSEETPDTGIAQLSPEAVPAHPPFGQEVPDETTEPADVAGSKLAEPGGTGPRGPIEPNGLAEITPATLESLDVAPDKPNQAWSVTEKQLEEFVSKIKAWKEALEKSSVSDAYKAAHPDIDFSPERLALEELHVNNVTKVLDDVRNGRAAA